MPITYPLIAGALKAYSRVAPTHRGGFRLARLARRFRPREQWRDTYRTPEGMVMDLDLSTYPDCCMAFGLYELETARLIKSMLKPGDHFVDGGANIGYFTLMAAQQVGPRGRVDAFEPQPENRARLQTHIARHNFDDRVRVHEVALSSEPGEATVRLFTGDHVNHGASSLFERVGVTTARTFQVRTARMDQVLAGTQPKLVKLDIEGAEPLAIAGMTALLQSNRPPAIIAELNKPTAKAAGFDPGEFLRRALDAQPRYEIFDIGVRTKRLPDIAAALEGEGERNLLLRVPD